MDARGIKPRISEVHQWIPNPAPHDKRKYGHTDIRISGHTQPYGHTDTQDSPSTLRIANLIENIE